MKSRERNEALYTISVEGTYLRLQDKDPLSQSIIIGWAPISKPPTESVKSFSSFLSLNVQCGCRTNDVQGEAARLTTPAGGTQPFGLSKFSVYTGIYVMIFMKCIQAHNM